LRTRLGNLQASNESARARAVDFTAVLSVSGIGELHMPKRPAPAIPENYNFARAYFELKKLREDVECFERLSGLSSDQAAQANVHQLKPRYR
jgi:hypothetical protein